MSATVINSTSPEFTCTTYQCTLDAEDIDTSYEYESNYTSSCDSDISSISFTSSAGTAGEDGEDGRGISSISRTSGDGSEGTTDTYTITYTDGTTSTFDVYNGADGADGSDGSDGNTITTGSGVPSGGSDGDLYVNTDNYDLYENQSGSWVVIGNIKGDTGDTGDTGPAGSDGSDGTSINWLADSSSAPASPSENDAYYNTSDEKSYIYDGSAWQTVAEDGIDGDQWTSGSGSPSDTTTLDYDSYYLNTGNGEVSKKAEGSSSWSVIATLSGAKYTTT